MYIDLSLTELKALSTALAVCRAVAKERLKGNRTSHHYLVGLTEVELKLVLAVTTTLENYIDLKMIPKDDEIIEDPPPWLDRKMRELEGGYHDEQIEN
jgi:hypothetical protein